MDPRRSDAWFSAVNPKQGLMLAYVWKRADFPWIGNWEQSYGRKESPWDGKSLTRGMEFTNTPFPVSLREAVDMGRFQGEKTFRWLTAKGGSTSLVYHWSRATQSMTVDYCGRLTWGP